MNISIFKDFKMNIVQIRRDVELGVYDNEDVYPLDTFRYKPEIIHDLIKEVEEVIANKETDE
jgi:hypothetical protein